MAVSCFIITHVYIQSYSIIFLYIHQNQTISTVYLNDQTYGISKLNKLAIALGKKKVFLHMYVIQSVFSFPKINMKTLKENVLFWACCSIGLHRLRYCKIKYILPYYRLAPFTTHNLVFQLTQRTLGVHTLLLTLMKYIHVIRQVMMLYSKDFRVRC